MSTALSAEGKRMFEEVMKENELLALENRLYDSFLQRNAAKIEEVLSSTEKPNRKPVTVRDLTPYQKLSLAVAEHDLRTQSLKRLEEQSQEDVGLLKALIDGIKIRINELRKETYSFRRDIMQGAVNSRTGKVVAERVLDYFDDMTKEKTALIEKLRQKNQAMRLHRAKMDAQVKHREEQGDSLHSIDFHQLQIKNSQFIAKMEERDRQLLRLKHTTTKTAQILNDIKQALHQELMEQRRIKREIRAKEDQLTKLAEDIPRIQEEFTLEKDRNQRFKIRQSNPDMPQVLDYIEQKSTMYELQLEKKNWQRKCEIMELAAKRASAALSRLGQPVSSPSSASPSRPGSQSGLALAPTLALPIASGHGSGRGHDRGTLDPASQVTLPRINSASKRGSGPG